ncbi:PepSY domain-containing protein [Mariniflexile litorale]|uniref:PepSY domain-containing protein n=1 Tax=Mariniflexile litorale TaxID=3045158 RepID=A0AAU7EC60_9FLAO|nr:PepSY domain-containing protein [Mariniflexile sp. KMM 9835]MDQ8212597.1 PepSY domain-containing protein [Mariniflexile sp. KMM 9835]
MISKIKTLSKETRLYRKFHKLIAIPMVIFMLILGITGVLLTWKNELQLKPSTEKSRFINKKLVSLNFIQNKATEICDSLKLSPEIDRIDYRPSKGIAKVRFKSHFTELQIDCASGKITSIKQRTDTIIEMIHDGSIIDFIFKSESKNFKLVYATTTSLALIFLAFSGFWLWLKPKKIKKLKKST